MGTEYEGIRITLDTNVLVSALGWNGAEAAVIEMVLESQLQLCLSIQILSEFYRVVKYPKFGFTDKETDVFIGRLMPLAIFVKPVQEIHIITADPDDNRIIECAVEGKCNYIISGDKHLLQLDEYKGIKIMKAPDFLQQISIAEED